ncbi:MAG: hypothetical protein WC208_16025 [Gallionella sp.]|jgi:hypothetical protein
MTGTVNSLRLIASVIGFYQCYVLGTNGAISGSLSGGSPRAFTYYGLLSLLILGNLISDMRGARRGWYNRLGLVLNPASVVLASMIPGEVNKLTLIFKVLVMTDGILYVVANIILWSTLIFGSNSNGGVEEMIVKFGINRETVNRMRVKVGNEEVE